MNIPFQVGWQQVVAATYWPCGAVVVYHGGFGAAQPGLVDE